MMMNLRDLTERTFAADGIAKALADALDVANDNDDTELWRTVRECAGLLDLLEHCTERQQREYWEDRCLPDGGMA